MNCKMKCSTLAVVCLVTILLQNFAGAQPSDQPPGFSDVPKNHWAWNSVNKMGRAGVIEGDLQDHFRGVDAMTRYEFAVAFSRFMNNMPTGTSICPPIGYDDFAAKADVNQILERLTAIENKLSELEKKVAVAPAALETSEVLDLRSEVRTAVAQTSNLVKRVED